MRKRLGDSVYDVIGHILEGVRLEELIMQAILHEDTTEVDHLIDVDLQRRVEEYRKALEESALAGHYIDLSAVLADSRVSRQRRLVPWDVERFTKFVAPLVGGECRPDPRKKGVFRISVPRIFLRQHGLDQQSFTRGLLIAFDRKTAREAGVEFFAPGHPLLDALCEHFLGKSRPVKAVLANPRGEEGVLWVFRARIQDGTHASILERLLALFWDAKTDEVREVDLRMLWDLKPLPEDVTVPDVLLEGLERSEAKVREWVVGHLEQLRSEAAKRREREARIKGEWLKRSFDHLIATSNSKLFEYHRRAERGEDMRIAIQQEEDNLKRLIQERKERLEALALEETLTVLEPELEMVVLILSPMPSEAKAETGEMDTERIETIGMEVAMRYEREQGRRPVDVSKEYLGYDIRSEGDGETRYIEVKAFAKTGTVRFTPHEWQMAQRLGDEYWLYVVEDALEQPKLRRIQNPAQRLPVREVLGVVEYVVEGIQKDERRF